MSSATTAAADSANTPALATGAPATSPTAYTSANRVASLVRSTGIQPSTARPEVSTTSGTRWTGIPTNRSYGMLSPLASRRHWAYHMDLHGFSPAAPHEI